MRVELRTNAVHSASTARRRTKAICKEGKLDAENGRGGDVSRRRGFICLPTRRRRGLQGRQLKSSKSRRHPCRPFGLRGLYGRIDCVAAVDLAAGRVGTHRRAAVLHHLAAAGVLRCGSKTGERRRRDPEGQHQQHQKRTCLPHNHSLYPSLFHKTERFASQNP